MNRVVILLLSLLLFVSYYSYGFTCSDISGGWSGYYSEAYCDGYSYSGTWAGQVYQDCRFTFSSDEGEIVSGMIDQNTKTFSVTKTDFECGIVSFTGTFTTNSVSGTYSYSAGGSGTITGNKQAQISATERAILKTLYIRTGGDYWKNNIGWKAYPQGVDGFAMPGTECGWYGITCDASGKYITHISLSENNLSGTIPPEIGNLKYLYLLYLWGNKLEGIIPPGLGKLSVLNRLSLSQNYLTGGIPRELGNLKSLRMFYCRSNKLSGSIPPEIGKLANLEDVTLRDNNLSGRIPPEIGKLTKLMYLYLYGNELSGKIPSEIGNLINLRELYLNDNELIGAIPKSLINLQKLTVLNIRYNHLYTNDAELLSFLNSKQIGVDWESSQTPPFTENNAKPWIPLLLLDERLK